MVFLVVFNQKMQSMWQICNNKKRGLNPREL